MKNKRWLLKVLALIILDVLIVVGTYIMGIVAFEIKLERYWYFIGISVIFQIFIFIISRLYRILLSHVGIIEFLRIIFGVIFSNLILCLFYRFIMQLDIDLFFYFYTIPVEILFITGVRFSKRIERRIFYAHNYKNNKYVNTLVVGAGSAAKLAFDEIQKNDGIHNRVLAFVDDDKAKFLNRLNGVPIVGPINSIPSIIDKYNIKEVIIAIANIDRSRLSEIIQIISVKSVKIKRLPLLLEEAVDSNRKILDVKIEDLLNRGVITLDNQGLNSFIADKVVLVTGGGGSIGSELCEQILSYNPKTLILFDIYENTTYETQMDLVKRIHKEQRLTELKVLIGSVYNRERIEEVFRKYHPQLVFHAAAYKHVPLMEDSAVEAVRTNILGTYNVASLCNEYQIEKMIMVSSDKAVRPTNIMGATKTACEHIIQYFDTISTTNYAAVRFGNVLGSHGSVVPLFKKQIEEGGPITITHPEITRFFMTIPEAVSLILQSGVYASGGEIFILDMGNPVKIVDLADKMIRLSGLVPNRDIQIEYVGLRPGEKLYEELLLDVSKNIKTANNKIYIEEKREILDIETFINQVKEKVDKVDNQSMKELVHTLVNTYKIDKNHIS